MYLALKEISFSKLKYSLIISVVALISYLVFFLTALAYGLASSYTKGIDKLNVSHFLLAKESNENYMMSFLKDSNYDEVNSNKKSKLGIFPAVILSNDKKDKYETQLFGIEGNLKTPDIYEGRIFKNDSEAVFDYSLKNMGYKIGDLVDISGNSLILKIVGFTKNSTFITKPIIFTNLNTWILYRFDSVAVKKYNAILINDNNFTNNTDLSVITTSFFKNNLPGYQAQVLTFSTMIGFLIFISSLVLSIFIYVLTIQKIPVFGVMKAQGIKNKFISNTVISQTLILLFIGVIIGLLLTLITGFSLGSLIPFEVNILFFLGISLLFILTSLLGVLFSIRVIKKIDPLIAIG